MKVIISVIFAGIIAMTMGFSQNSSSSKEIQIQKFIDQPNKTIRDTIVDIGKLNDINIKIIKAVNLTDNDLLSGVIISYENNTDYPRKDILYIDADEVDDLIKTLTDWKLNAFSQTPVLKPDVSLVYHYTSRSGFKVGAFTTIISNSNGKTMWNIFLHFCEIEKYRIFITIEEFGEFIKILSVAKTKLEIK